MTAGGATDYPLPAVERQPALWREVEPDPLETGFELEDLVVGNGSASELQGNNATYTATITPEASGTVTVDIEPGAGRIVAEAGPLP